MWASSLSCTHGLNDRGDQIRSTMKRLIYWHVQLCGRESPILRLSGINIDTVLTDTIKTNLRVSHRTHRLIWNHEINTKSNNLCCLLASCLNCGKYNSFKKKTHYNSDFFFLFQCILFLNLAYCLHEVFCTIYFYICRKPTRTASCGANLVESLRGHVESAVPTCRLRAAVKPAANRETNELLQWTEPVEQRTARCFTHKVNHLLLWC